jgi:hypothetical protein
MELADYEPTVDWNPHLRKYQVSVSLDTGREDLVFDTLKEGTDYRLQYMADIKLLLEGMPAVHGSGAIL